MFLTAPDITLLQQVKLKNAELKSSLLHVIYFLNYFFLTLTKLYQTGKLFSASVILSTLTGSVASPRSIPLYQA